MYILEIPLIAYTKIIDCIAFFSSRIPSGLRNAMLNVSVFCMMMLGVLAYSNERIKHLVHYDRYVLKAAGILLVVILIASIDRKISEGRKCRIRGLFWLGWYLCFGTMIVSAQFHHVNRIYYAWGIISNTLLPMIMLVWQKRGDFEYLCNRIARCTVLAAYVFLAANLCLTAFVTNTGIAEMGYLGIAGNPNSNGLIALPFFTAALYLLLTDRKYTPLYLFSVIVFAVFVYISRTRATELAILLEAAAAVCVYISHREIYRWRGNVVRAIAVLLIAAALAAAVGYALQYVDRVDMNAYAADEFNELEESVHTVWADERLTRINDLSSGRLVLWMTYLKLVGIKGHGTPSGALFYDYEFTRWAHNNALDIWYASGFPAFAGYVMWLLAGWIFVFRSMRKKSTYRKEYLLPVLAFIGYFVEAMLEITIYPMYTGIVFLSFMTLVPAAFAEAEVLES